MSKVNSLPTYREADSMRHARTIVERIRRAPSDSTIRDVIACDQELKGLLLLATGHVEAAEYIASRSFDSIQYLGITNKEYDMPVRKYLDMLKIQRPWHWQLMGWD